MPCPACPCRGTSWVRVGVLESGSRVWVRRVYVYTCKKEARSQMAASLSVGWLHPQERQVEAEARQEQAHARAWPAMSTIIFKEYKLQNGDLWPLQSAPLMVCFPPPLSG